MSVAIKKSLLQEVSCEWRIKRVICVGRHMVEDNVNVFSLMIFLKTIYFL